MTGHQVTLITSRLTAVATALGIALAGLVAGQALGASNPHITQAVPADDTIVSGCVIRFSAPDGSPSIHANSAHQCAGVKSVGINEYGEIRVTQTVTGAAENPILFAVCQTDETLGGRRGITCGASGGTGETRFQLFDGVLDRPLDLTKGPDRMRVQGKNANLWVGWFHAPTGGVQ